MDRRIREFNPAAGSILTATWEGPVCASGSTDLAAELVDRRMHDIDIAAGPEALCRQLIAEFEVLLSETDTPRSRVRAWASALPAASNLPDPGVGSTWPAFPLAAQLAEHFGTSCLVDRDVTLLASASKVPATPPRAYTCAGRWARPSVAGSRSTATSSTASMASPGRSVTLKCWVAKIRAGAATGGAGVLLPAERQ